MQFTHARATAPLTLPSHVSILTGALPPAHGVRENGTHVFTGNPAPVARQLKEAGYRTAAFVGAYVLDRRFGLSDGFDHYDDQISRDPRAVMRLESERPANEVVGRAAAWLRPGTEGVRPRGGQTPLGSDPIFMWVHLYDPHAPYTGSYDQEVKFADAHFGRLLQEVRAAGRNPVVMVLGDHGESLGEHGERTHGMLVYEAALRVPLIIAGPGISARRRSDPVSLIDIAPTLIELSGSQHSNRSLLRTAGRDREIYAESEYPRVAGWSPVYSLLQDRWKLILSRDSELYDLAADPAESTNVAGARQPLVRAMTGRLEALRAPAETATRRSASSDVAERLRALGYVAGSSSAPEPGDGPNPAEHIGAWGEFEEALSDIASGDRTAALRRLKQLAGRYPDAPVFQATYARMLSETGAAASALALYRRAVARWPDDAMLFHELAVAARGAGLVEEAMKAEQAAVALEPDMPAAHNGIGLLMTDAGRHRTAVLSFERAVKADPTNAEYWVNLGNARAADGNHVEAERAYRQAAELEPRSADAMNGLGVLLVQQKRAVEAIPWFQRALEASPDFLQARLNLGIAYQESGQPDRAGVAYREVLESSQLSAPERRVATDLLRSLGKQ